MLTFGSLFAGIGGIDLGLERAGMVCKWQVEIDPFCQKVLAKHWPNVRRYGDVRECGGHSLETVDLICGGFPCQPHSIAGKRRGAEDDRNLWPEFIRIITELRPRYVLAENVPGIITTYLDTVLSDLENAGYTCGAFNLPAVAFNAPHRRERIFIVAYSDNRQPKQPQRDNTERGSASKSRPGIGAGAGSGIVNGNYAQRNSCTRRNSKEMAQAMADADSERLEREGQTWTTGDSSYWTTERRVCGMAPRLPQGMDGLDKAVESHWHSEWPGVSRIIAGQHNRTHRLRALGNAVVPAIARWIGERILEWHLANTREQD